MKNSEFCRKIRDWEKQLYAVAYSILQNETDAEDAVCSSIQIAYEKQEQLKDIHKFKPWLFSILKNEALKLCKKRVDLPGEEKIEASLEPVYDGYDELWDVLQKLPEEYRIVIVLHYYADLSVSEIASLLDIAEGTVKSRLNRGRNKLREMLDDREG